MSRNYYRHLIEGSAPAPTDLFTNAVAYYKLDETSGQAIDVVNNYNADLLGGITRGVAGKIGNAYEFNSSNGYLDCGDQNDFSFTDGTNNIPFTLRCWVNFYSLFNNPRLFLKRNGDDDFELITLVIDRKIYFTMLDINRNLCQFIGTNEIASTQWYHLVFTKGTAFNNSDIKVYVNGAEEQNSASYQTYSGNFNGTESLTIGTSRPSFNSYGNFLNGKLDEIAIIKNEAWTPAQVSADYNNGLGTTI